MNRYDRARSAANLMLNVGLVLVGAGFGLALALADHENDRADDLAGALDQVRAERDARPAVGIVEAPG